MNKGNTIKEFIESKISFSIYLIELQDNTKALWVKLQGMINIDLDTGLKLVYELQEFREADYLVIEITGKKTMMNSMAIGTLIGTRNSCPKSLFCVVTEIERILEVFEMIVLPIPYFEKPEEAEKFLLKGNKKNDQKK